MPLCEVRRRAALHLKQSRYLPLGSTGDADQDVADPRLRAYPSASPRESGTAGVVHAAHPVEGDLPLGATCPAWVMPNADGAGYYGFTLRPTT